MNAAGAALRLRVFEHDVVDSTSERAFEELAAGRARHGDVHIAREQTAGRGRRGASWASARDLGLYASVVLRPTRPVHPAALTIGAGLATLEAARDLGALDARLKWPNDVLVGAAKLAGILVETRGLDLAAPHYVVGVGLNVRQREFPAELLAQRAVTSLALCGVECTLERARETLLTRLASRLEQAVAEAPRLCADYVAATQFAGHVLEVECGEEHVAGVFVELTLRGLVVRTAEGLERRCALEHVRAVRIV